jgi:D-threo-aldose 1-dehydrogenase
MDVSAGADLSALPPRFGFGTSGLGNLGRELTEPEAQLILSEAWAAGFRYFDTSPFYGYGLSELRLGQFLRDRPRSEFAVSTKVGRYLVPPHGRSQDPGIWAPPLDLVPITDYTYEGTRRALEQSHSRLGLSRIDIALIHDVDRRSLGGDFDARYAEACSGAFKALTELRSAGFIGAIGVGLNEADVAADFIRDLDIDLVMLAGRYTLLDQSGLEACLPIAEQRSVGIIAVGVFNSGILVTGAVPGATYDYAPASVFLLEQTSKIEDVCRRYDVPLGAVAAQFPFGHPTVRTVVLGANRVEQSANIARLLTHPVPNQLWADLRAEGLLADHVPTPI